MRSRCEIGVLDRFAGRLATRRLRAVRSPSSRKEATRAPEGYLGPHGPMTPLNNFSSPRAGWNSSASRYSANLPDGRWLTLNSELCSVRGRRGNQLIPGIACVDPRGPCWRTSCRGSTLPPPMVRIWRTSCRGSALPPSMVRIWRTSCRGSALPPSVVRISQGIVRWTMPSPGCTSKSETTGSEAAAYCAEPPKPYKSYAFTRAYLSVLPLRFHRTRLIFKLRSVRSRRSNRFNDSSSGSTQPNSGTSPKTSEVDLLRRPTLLLEARTSTSASSLLAQPRSRPPRYGLPLLFWA
jgi:hypothetical protein